MEIWTGVLRGPVCAGAGKQGEGVVDPMAWIMQNLGTIIACLVLIVITGAIVLHMIKNKKSGKSSCGCNCGGCPMSGTCQKEVKKE